MSHLRDLQRLRIARNSNGMGIVGSSRGYNEAYGLGAEKSNEEEGYSKYLQSKELSSRPREKKSIPKRTYGSSLGSHEPRQVLSVTPGLAVYNFSMKFSNRKAISLTGRREQAGLLRNESSQPQRVSMQNSHRPLSKANFIVMYPVGKGGFGKVWKVQSKRSKVALAMKEMSKVKIISKKSINSVMNERMLLEKVRHPFLVNMSYAFQDRESLYLVMDYLDGGDLRYHIGKLKNFGERETKFFLANIIIGLEYLHSHKIIHRDIKPENLVLDTDGYLRITDLGVSRELRDDNHEDTSGTPGYMAPEVMCRKNHSLVADFFALGVIGYEFMLGRRPYNGRNRKQIRDQILSKQAAVRIDELPFRWSPDAVDCINKLLLRNPEQRLGWNGIDKIKNHRWFIDMDWNKLADKKVKAPYMPVVRLSRQRASKMTTNNTRIKFLRILLQKMRRNRNFSFVMKKSSISLMATNSTAKIAKDPYPTLQTILTSTNDDSTLLTSYLQGTEISQISSSFGNTLITSIQYLLFNSNQVLSFSKDS